MPAGPGGLLRDCLPAFRGEAFGAFSSTLLPIALRDWIGWRIIGEFADGNAAYMNSTAHSIGRASLWHDNPPTQCPLVMVVRSWDICAILSSLKNLYVTTGSSIKNVEDDRLVQWSHFHLLGCR